MFKRGRKGGRQGDTGRESWGGGGGGGDRGIREGGGGGGGKRERAKWDPTLLYMYIYGSFDRIYIGLIWQDVSLFS